MTTPTSRFVPRWHTVFVAALTIGLLWLFFRNVNVGEVWRAILHANPWFLIAAIVVTVLTWILRAVRWLVLLAPVGRARFRTAFRTTVIGFAATFLLPGRVGEILRPFLLARQEGFKATTTFATVIVERLLDVATVMLLFACALPFAGVTVGRDIMIAGGLSAAAALGALVVLFVFAGHPERVGQWVERLSRLLPARAATAAARVARAFAEGLAVMRSPGQLVTAAAWSLPLWISIAISIWLTSWAFDLTFPFSGSFLVMMCLAAGVSLPTPGGVGGFHWTYRFAVTTFFGADVDVAAAAAFVLHAVSFVPVTIVGLVCMWQDGLTLAGLRRMRATAEAAEMP
jgi:uncharacterized protein (TIRG00374 family)